MKHNVRAISLIVLLFFVAQIIGLAVTSAYIQKPELPMKIERPQVTEQQKSYTFVPILIFVLLATALAFILLRFQLLKIWKFWFLLSVWLCLSISFNAFIPEKFAIALAAIFALWKVYKNNVVIHNLTEVFIYSALTAIFAPILNVISVVFLLMGISAYDYIAVRKTKHMISLAKFQSKTRLFAGLLLPYQRKDGLKDKGALDQKAVSRIVSLKPVKQKASVAILGGGDIGFPILFAGVVMREFGLPFLSLKTFIIPLFAAVSLFMLFLFGKDKKFYPAMPYLTAGCLAGYGLMMLF